MDLTPEQRAAIEHDGHLVVTAGAGSGKTRVLVERYLRLLDDVGHPDPFAAILAVTFTEKAAREMRERVRLALERRAGAGTPAGRVRQAGLAAAVEGARIGTIHGFCATLLRAHPVETGLDPRFAILDEVEAGLLLAESVDEALRDVVRARGEGTEATRATLPAGLEVLLEEFGPAEVRAALVDLLRGGGETRAALRALPSDPAALLRHWHERLALARAETLAELFAGATWREAVAALLALAPGAPADDRIGAQVRAVAAWLSELDPDAPDFAVLDALNLQGGSKRLWGNADDLNRAREALRALREAYRAVAEFLAFAPDPRIEERAALATLALRNLFEIADARYTERKAALDRLDFDDLERRARDLLERHPDVRARWRAALRAVLVDEFQDTNDDQRAIIYALARPSDAPGAAGPGLFVVGDGKQSIYRFRGADVSVFREVEDDIQRWGGRRLALQTSFRAHATLVELINGLGERLFWRPRPQRSFEVPYEPLAAHRPAPAHSITAEWHVLSNAGEAAERRAAEAALLAGRLADLVDGAAGPIVHDPQHGWRAPAYGDIALLFQAATSFEPFETALRERGIPYLTTAGRGYYGRQEVLDLIHLLRTLDDPGDELALVGVLRSPLFAVDDGTIMALKLSGAASLWEALLAAAEDAAADAGVRFAARTLGELHALRGRSTVVELLRTALDRTAYLAIVSALEDGERRRANVEKLLAAARLAGARGLRAFREYLDLLLRVEAREGDAPLEAHGAVRLMTVHRSKGLEFPVVALPDLGRAPSPLRERWLARRAYGLALQVRDPADEQRRPAAFLLARHTERQLERAERERLLYVALTRARDYLILSGSAQATSDDGWHAALAAALGHPWERGGPPAGALGPLLIIRHDMR
ncbi:MAG: UvrD-helicase domain-containing protein [Chloroflexaceae bacterium]|nr:UvrD-helicase domain-containing protein [Chloroflexaceae bacterium]